VSSPSTVKPLAGFTLVEVLVALAVVAIALPALLFSLNQQVDGTGYMRDKSLAAMVAANKLEEIRIVTRAQSSLKKGKDSGLVELADREWFWWTEVETTTAKEFYRLKIRVAASEEQRDYPLASLDAFLMADLRQANITDGSGDSGDGSATGEGQ
jgi:general secretion pathway protein I